MDILTSIEYWINFVFQFLNMGLAGGMILGFLWLLRPMTTRLLTPRQRVWLWGVGWLGAYMPAWYGMLSWLHLLPVTLRDLITPRFREAGHLPEFLPHYELEGTYNLAFLGGGAVQVELNNTIGIAVLVFYAAGLVLFTYRLNKGEKRLRELGEKGELLTEDHPLNKYANREEGFVHEHNVDIYLCDDIPTSFVQHGKGNRRQVCLQKALPEHRRELVLKHEVNHFRLGHCRLKGIINVALALHWWNPIIWLAYFAACRDLELDCDERTLEELSLDERREYAHTLVELGVGKQLWDAPLSFGECDAAARVKAVAAWKPRQTGQLALGLLLTVFLMLFITGGPAFEDVELPVDVALAQQRHRGMLMEQAQGLADELIVHLRAENAAENSDAVDQIWLSKEGEVHVLCYLAGGGWRQVGVWVWEPNRRGSEIYFEEVTPVVSPDLSYYQRIY